MFRLLTILGFIAILAVATVYRIWWIYHPAGLPIEVAKTALNILTVAVIAQLASFTVTSAIDHRKLTEARDELRKQTLRRVTSAFSKTKSLRRYLRSQLRYAGRDTLLDRANLRTRDYRSALSTINAVQLDLELVAKDVETDHSLFKNAKDVFLGISRMEEYLNRLIDEWEHGSALSLSETDTVTLSDLPRILDLLGEYKTSLFRPNFVHAFYETAELIRGDIKDGRAMTWKKAATSIS